MAKELFEHWAGEALALLLLGAQGGFGIGSELVCWNAPELGGPIEKLFLRLGISLGMDDYFAIIFDDLLY